LGDRVLGIGAREEGSSATDSVTDVTDVTDFSPMEVGKREYSHSNSFSYQKLPNIQLSVGIMLFNSQQLTVNS